ncbi:MAG: hypothetical protein J6B23_08340 [Clostridia bacterium]|nr:hypothetical protein [Clostridia bacterium]
MRDKAKRAKTTAQKNILYLLIKSSPHKDNFSSKDKFMQGVSAVVKSKVTANAYITT